MIFELIRDLVLPVGVGPVVVVRVAVDQVDGGARHAADGPVEAVADAGVHVACVEALVALVQGHKVLNSLIVYL